MKPTVSQIETFLREVDFTFPVPLSHKQNLHDFAVKLFKKATLCCAMDGGKIAAAVAGYTNDLIKNIAYISIVATRPDFRGKGLASRLLREFVDVCRRKKIDAVHFYVAQNNSAALRLYERLGFVRWVCPNEPRPNDVHMIYYIEKVD